MANTTSPHPLRHRVLLIQGHRGGPTYDELLDATASCMILDPVLQLVSVAHTTCPQDSRSAFRCFLDPAFKGPARISLDNRMVRAASNFRKICLRCSELSQRLSRTSCTGPGAWAPSLRASIGGRCRRRGGLQSYVTQDQSETKRLPSTL